jgi:hypothetical protein
VLLRISQHEPDLDGVPDVLRGPIMACLAKRPEDRPTAAELGSMLGIYSWQRNDSDRLIALTSNEIPRLLATLVLAPLACLASTIKMVDLNRPGRWRGSDLARRLEPCLHLGSSKTRARAVRLYADRLRDHGESRLAARKHVGALLDINPATIRNWVEAEQRAGRPAG